MQRSVAAALAFIEGPMVAAKRGAAISDVVDYLKENMDSGTLVDLGIAPNALFKKAIITTGSPRVASGWTGIGPVFQPLDAWLSVRIILALAVQRRFVS